MKKAILYRMVTDKHICPYGIRTKELLKSEGYEVEDKHLTSREQTDEFKAEHDVKTTPQTFIEGKRIGGYEDVCRFLGKEVKDRSKKTYRPVLALFAVAAVLALVTKFEAVFAFDGYTLFMTFVGYAMVLLAAQKLQDVFAFANSFMTYDLLALRQPKYANLYPYLEAFVGIGMLAALPIFIIAPVSIVIGTIGAVSVIKAVYIDRRELSCACVGGNSNVPLGFVSLTENVVMVLAGVLMFSHWF